MGVYYLHILYDGEEMGTQDPKLLLRLRIEGFDIYENIQFSNTLILASKEKWVGYEEYEPEPSELEKLLEPYILDIQSS